MNLQAAAAMAQARKVREEQRKLELERNEMIIQRQKAEQIQQIQTDEAEIWDFGLENDNFGTKCKCKNEEFQIVFVA